MSIHLCCCLSIHQLSLLSFNENDKENLFTSMYFSVLLIHHKGFFSNKAAIFVVYFHGLGCIRGVVGEGMPAYRRPYDRGNLYVKFEIEFPPNNFIPGDKISVSTYFLCVHQFSKIFHYSRSFLIWYQHPSCWKSHDVEILP